MSTVDSFGAKDVLDVNGTQYEIYRLQALKGAEALPYSLKILLENLPVSYTHLTLPTKA